ncbi:EpsD family peptidyl-prolyl cis-trans isomerase [Janthinobacterium sp. PLB04]|uniref:peptidylprolyl isomerase n=2 Tax=Oxalobacteraceae TaxID=75682 RepID=A0AAJ4T7Y3_9BURK|nr:MULTISPECIES: EpsD family peptidyl-prolyl cis-trans isomerase [Janthinobacterium]KAB0332349.1 peptidyl-prolyl cis-trans isomerase, EpsD family [Janthinobacterium lividum]QSX99093.1 EpsD family peptidyl-prolyl cis-trans isomerase [Janthinobacterium lividum]UGQ39020.1 EpsD family peptidyl-prolyl cis-trans isomerase [Janthinobacterium sp. PLB04]
MLCSALVLLTAVGMAACGNKEKKAGQALASVNGEEITVLQLNEEMQRANVQAVQQEAASKQLLESLIDRQLLLNEAVKEKMDRDPKVVQAVERAKSLIIAQAYMQKKIGALPRPGKAEVEAYFEKNPQYFSQRKQFDMRELIIASADMNDALKAAMDAAKSLDDVAAWLDTHQVKYGRTQLSRSSADLAPELSGKLLTMPKGQLFIIREGDRTLLISLVDIKDSPVTLAQAAPQIEQFLANKKTKEVADAELKRLRATAKIEYLNKPAAGKDAASTAASASAAPSASVSAPAAPAAVSNEMNERGAAGLK